MANIHLTYQDMNNAANQLVAGQQDIDNKLQELQTNITNLVAEGYVTDQSSVAFDEQFNTFRTNATQVVSALDGMAQFLRSAATTMEQTDAQLAAALRQ